MKEFGIGLILELKIKSHKKLLFIETLLTFVSITKKMNLRSLNIIQIIIAIIISISPGLDIV